MDSYHVLKSLVETAWTTFKTSYEDWNKKNALIGRGNSISSDDNFEDQMKNTGCC